MASLTPLLGKSAGSSETAPLRGITLSPDGSSGLVQDPASMVVFEITFGIALVLQIPMYEEVQGYTVPAVFFKGLPSLFYPFVFLCAVAFTASLKALCIRPTYLNRAWFCRLFSLVSLGAATILLISATFATRILDRTN